MPGSPASIVSSTTNTVSTIESTSGHTNDRSSISSIPSTISEEVPSSSFHIPKLSISSERPLSPDAISTVGGTSVPPTPTTTSSRPHLSSSLHSKLIPNDASGFGPSWHWRAGAIHRGHPSIIPLLEFFEDAHFYYLILPAANPSFPPSPHFPPVSLPAAHPSHAAVATNGTGSGSLLANGNGNGGEKEKKFPSDLFDLVERYPYGLPTALVRTYLGQIADGLAFLHARGICHRDIKDENVVLADDGRCWLIDFGSSGVVRKEGWDTFSGTLDYAGPEILAGETYKGPPQDVWAFGIVSYVLVVGECPFSSAAEAAVGLATGSKALVALEERCGRPPPPANVPLSDSPPLLYPPHAETPPPSLDDSERSSNSTSPQPPAPPVHAVPDLTELDFTDLFGSPAFHGYDAVRDSAKMEEGREQDGGGRLGDAMALIKACLQLDVAARPTFDDILLSRYMSGCSGWVELGDIPSRQQQQQQEKQSK